ncbi:MAG: hypothetical protein PV358_12715, partial [Acidimicrobiales bacterium]|nr:hypothetical protein [Acidimicrobiales bacterium]
MERGGVLPHAADVGDRRADTLGVAGDLLIEEAQGLPSGSGGLCIPSVVTCDVAHAGVPASAVGLEDHSAVAVRGVDQALDRARPRQRHLTLRDGEPARDQSADEIAFQPAPGRRRTLVSLVEQASEGRDPWLAGPHDLGQPNRHLIEAGTSVEDQVVEHAAESTRPKAGRTLDDRPRRFADGQTVDRGDMARPQVVDLVDDGAIDARVGTVGNRQGDRSRCNVRAAADPGTRLVRDSGERAGRQQRRPDLAVPGRWRARDAVHAGVNPRPGAPLQASLDRGVAEAERKGLGPAHVASLSGGETGSACITCVDRR